MFSLVTYIAIAVLPQAPQGEGVSTMLAHAAKEEMTIVERVQSLRKATEKLPKTWRVRNRRTKKLITKEVLLYELETMELMAAERWNTIVRNLAMMTELTPKLRSTIEGDVKALYKLQSAMNKRLDNFNKRLKAGILVNLAAKLESSSGDEKTVD